MRFPVVGILAMSGALATGGVPENDPSFIVSAAVAQAPGSEVLCAAQVYSEGEYALRFFDETGYREVSCAGNPLCDGSLLAIAEGFVWLKPRGRLHHIESHPLGKGSRQTIVLERPEWAEIGTYSGLYVTAKWLYVLYYKSEAGRTIFTVGEHDRKGKLNRLIGAGTFGGHLRTSASTPRCEGCSAAYFGGLPDGRLYLAIEGAGDIRVFDPASLSVDWKVVSLASSSDDRVPSSLQVAGIVHGDGQLGVLLEDPASATVVSMLDSEVTPHKTGKAAVGASGYAWISRNLDALRCLDAKTQNMVTLPVTWESERR